MELELKYLVGYLPYGLKCICRDEIEVIEGFRNETYYINSGNKYAYGDIQECKPILRPLSELTREEFNYLYTLLRVHIGKNKRDKLINEGYGISDLSYFIFEQLLENHFDLFNLIENELAIDKNTL